MRQLITFRNLHSQQKSTEAKHGKQIASQISYYFLIITFFSGIIEPLRSNMCLSLIQVRDEERMNCGYRETFIDNSSRELYNVNILSSLFQWSLR